MPTTFKAVVNTAQKRRDGTYNVKIRVTHRRRSVKLATNVYLTDQQVTKKGRIKDQRIVDQCEDIIRKWRNAANQLGVSADALEVEDVVRYITNAQAEGSTALDLFVFGRKCMETMVPGTRSNYETTLNAVKRYIGSDKLDIREITVSFLQKFEAFLLNEPRLCYNRKDGVVATKRSKANGRVLSSYMACLRHLHNLAKDQFNDEDRGVILIPNSPFKKYKIKSAPAPKKRAISPEVLQAIINIPDVEFRCGPPQAVSRRDLARDCFLLSFGLAGMNAADLYGSNAKMKGDSIVYNRQKTASRRADEAEFHIRVEPCLKPLIEKYRDPSGERLFCFYRWYRDGMTFNAGLNLGLKHIDKVLAQDETLAEHLPEHITFYSARHSWATIARSSKLNIDKYTVHEGLNHIDDTMRITDIYIDRDYTNIWNANAKVLGLFDWSAIKK